VLHLLDVAADHQRPLADDGAGEVDHRGEAADAEDQGGDSDQANCDMAADAGADLRAVRRRGLFGRGEGFHVAHDAAASSRPFCGWT
jgi:hypothetical protein